MASAEQLHHLCSLLALAPCAAAAAAVVDVVAAAVVVVAAVAAVVAAVAVAVTVVVAVAGAVAADGQALAAVAEQQLPFDRSVLLLDLAFPAFQAGGQFAEVATLADWHSG